MITTTLTWTPDYQGDPEMPPVACVVREIAAAWWQGDSGFSHDGCGDIEAPQLFGGQSSGTHYRVIRNPGLSFTITCTPECSAESTYGGGSNHWPSAVVNYTVSATPIRVTLGGLVDPDNDRRLLIGQGLSVFADLGGLATTGDNQFAWDVTGGTAFTRYVPTALPVDYLAWLPVTTTTTETHASISSMHFAAPDRVTVAVAITTTSPALFIPIKVPCDTVAPTFTHGSGSIGTMTLLHCTTNVDNTPITDNLTPTDFRLWGATYPGWPTTGIYYNYWIETPSPWATGDVGAQSACQVVTWNDSITDLDGTQTSAGTGLDGSYPYGVIVNNHDNNWFPASRHQNQNGTLNWRIFSDRPGVSSRDTSQPPNPIPFQAAGVSKVSIDDSFMLYMMYSAPWNGLQSLDVPVHLVHWHAIGGAAVGTPWTTNGLSAAIDLELDFPPHPVWAQVKH